MSSIDGQQVRAQSAQTNRSTLKMPLSTTVGLVCATVICLRVMGRVWWCKHDTLAAPITLEAWSTHTSQHFFDPYAISHVLHGFLFLWLLQAVGWVIPKMKMSVGWMCVTSVAIECGWEILENSSIIIDRYRAQTAALDYFGDSIANSFGDILSCIFGFWLAYQLRWKAAIVMFIAAEAISLYWIRDNLTLNILMLTYPITSIKEWQRIPLETVLWLGP